MDEEFVVRSPIGMDPVEIPNISFPDFVLAKVEKNLPLLGQKPWLIDTASGNTVYFSEVESKTRKIASFLARNGFKKGDVLHFVTYRTAFSCLIQFAVWRLGGVTRGSYQAEIIESYEGVLKETKCKFVMVDDETGHLLQAAIGGLDWKVTLITIGDRLLRGAITLAEILEDDGTAFPKSIPIDPKEDLMCIFNTSGTTGKPKGVLHSHYSTIAILTSFHGLKCMPTKSFMASTSNFGVVNFVHGFLALCQGCTFYHIAKYEQSNFFDLIFHYKPSNIILYPYVATWFAKCSAELTEIKAMDILESISITGWVLDYATTNLLVHQLPKTMLITMYGLSECFHVSVGSYNEAGKLPPIDFEGGKSVSSGKLIPMYEAKVVDPESRDNLPVGAKGEILVRSPTMMLGYLVPGGQPNRADIDKHGWLKTGDIGYFDKDGNIYIQERIKFIFKYFMRMVSPSEIESVLQEHPDVVSAGVVGVPDPESTCLARALVVLRPGKERNAKELYNFVADRLPNYKHLHGGVHFVEKLPVNAAGKMDRKTLMAMAIDKELSGFSTEF
ncbi:uncharacterized protein LOC132201376 [Neocloeon triangulifer]|uniref:uncharacterized protein LOC132201376 n=1 Tax=Neocloeon triangulifer TaxID=2078957 RepID=UPI00286F798E|nr:uncharacterized protein LOC132201376 [Neocloeon triangulifer]